MTEVLTLTIENHIAEVRLNRPEKMNALNMELLTALSEMGRELATNKDVRAVVISGNGACFSAGMDFSVLSDPDWLNNPGKHIDASETPNFYQKPGYGWKSVPVPVICALHGSAVGGGMQIALGADMRVAHPDTKMAVGEINWGLIPDMSGSQTLRDLVGLDVAKDLFLTGRFVEAPEAKELGLVTYVDENPRERAMEIAKGIAKRNPNAIAASKFLLEQVWHGNDIHGMKLEELLQLQIIGKPNQMEAVMARLEKRDPKFAPRDDIPFETLLDDAMEL